jgi:hypothetical protein
MQRTIKILAKARKGEGTLQELKCDVNIQNWICSSQRGMVPENSLTHLPRSSKQIKKGYTQTS